MRVRVIIDSDGVEVVVDAKKDEYAPDVLDDIARRASDVAIASWQLSHAADAEAAE